jgi:hypothetical protein
MKQTLKEKLLSRKFLVTLATATAAFATGNQVEAIYTVMVYLAGQSTVDAISQAFPTKDSK